MIVPALVGKWMLRGGTYSHVNGDILKPFLPPQMPYYSSLLSTTPRKIPEKIVVLTLKLYRFRWQQEFIQWKQIAQKAFCRDSIWHFGSAFWLGCAFRNCRIYCVFYRIALPQCWRGSSNGRYAFVGIYLFNLAPARLHCLSKHKIIYHGNSQRWYHYHFS